MFCHNETHGCNGQKVEHPRKTCCRPGSFSQSVKDLKLPLFVKRATASSISRARLASLPTTENRRCHSCLFVYDLVKVSLRGKYIEHVISQVRTRSARLRPKQGWRRRSHAAAWWSCTIVFALSDSTPSDLWPLGLLLKLCPSLIPLHAAGADSCICLCHGTTSDSNWDLQTCPMIASLFPPLCLPLCLSFPPIRHLSNHFPPLL